MNTIQELIDSGEYNNYDSKFIDTTKKSSNIQSLIDSGNYNKPYNLEGLDNLQRTNVGLTGLGESQYDTNIAQANLPNLQQIRANRQSGLDQFANAMGKGVVNGLLTTLETASYIVDAPANLANMAQGQAVTSNWLAELAKEGKAEMNELLPIYRKNNELIDFSDSGFYFDALAGVIDSAVGFGITGLGAGALVKGVGGLLKISDAATKANRAQWLANRLGTALQEGKLGTVSTSFLQNMGESTMMGLETYESTYNHILPELVNNFKKSNNEREPNEEELKKLASLASAQAGKAANTNFLYNQLFLVSNVIQLNALHKAKGLIEKPDLRSFLKSQVKGAPIEGLEEIGQSIASKEAQFEIEDKLKEQNLKEYGIDDLEYVAPVSFEKDFMSRLIEFGTSEQALLEGAMGLVSGPIQYTVTQLPFQNFAKQKEQYNNQQEAIANIKEFFENSNKEFVETQDLKAKLVESGYAEAASALEDGEFDHLVIRNMGTNTDSQIEATLQENLNNPETSEEDKKYFQQKLDRLNEIKTTYNKNKKYGDPLNTTFNQLEIDRLKRVKQLNEELKGEHSKQLQETLQTYVDNYNSRKNDNEEELTVGQVLDKITNQQVNSEDRTRLNTINEELQTNRRNIVIEGKELPIALTKEDRENLNKEKQEIINKHIDNNFEGLPKTFTKFYKASLKKNSSNHFLNGQIDINSATNIALDKRVKVQQELTDANAQQSYLKRNAIVNSNVSLDEKAAQIQELYDTVNDTKGEANKNSLVKALKENETLKQLVNRTKAQIDKDLKVAQKEANSATKESSEKSVKAKKKNAKKDDTPILDEETTLAKKEVVALLYENGNEKLSNILSTLQTKEEIDNFIADHQEEIAGTSEQDKEGLTLIGENDPVEEDLPIGKLKDTGYEVKEDGVYFQDKILKNENDLSNKDLIRQHFNNRKKLDFLNKNEDKKVTLNGVTGTLNKINNFRYELLDNDKIYEFSFEQITTFEVVEEKYNITQIDEDTVTVNNVDYVINLDEQGNIISLSPTNKPEQQIKNSKLVIAVEIQRNKLEFKKEETQEDQKVLDNLEKKYPRLNFLLGNIWGENLTDTVATALDKLYDNRELNEQEKLQAALWLSDVFDRILNLSSKENNKEEEEIILKAYNTAEIINSLLYETNDLTLNKNEKPRKTTTNLKQAKANINSKKSKEEVERVIEEDFDFSEGEGSLENAIASMQAEQHKVRTGEKPKEIKPTVTQQTESTTVLQQTTLSEGEVHSYDNTTTIVNKKTYKDQTTNTEVSELPHVKVTNKGKLISPDFERWSKNGSDKSGAKVHYEIDEMWFQENKPELYKEFLKLKQDILAGNINKLLLDKVARGLPVKLIVDEYNNTPLGDSYYSFLFEPNPPSKYKSLTTQEIENKKEQDTKAFRAEMQLRRQILINLALGLKAESEIKGQYGGELLTEEINKNILLIPDFNGDVTQIEIYVSDKDGDIVDGNGDPVAKFKGTNVTHNDKKLAGAIFTSVNKNNGQPFPLKLNIRPYSENELRLIKNIYGFLLDPSNKKQNLFNQPITQAMADLLSKEDLAFLKGKKESLPSFSEVLKHIVYEGETTSANTVTQLFIKDGELHFGENKATQKDYASKIEEFTQFLLAFKKPNVNMRRLSSEPDYKEHIITNGYLLTDAVIDPEASTLFQQRTEDLGTETDGNYLDRHLGGFLFTDNKLLETKEVEFESQEIKQDNPSKSKKEVVTLPVDEISNKIQENLNDYVVSNIIPSVKNIIKGKKYLLTTFRGYSNIATSFEIVTATGKKKKESSISSGSGVGTYLADSFINSKGIEITTGGLNKQIKEFPIININNKKEVLEYLLKEATNKKLLSSPKDSKVGFDILDKNKENIKFYFFNSDLSKDNIWIPYNKDDRNYEEFATAFLIDKYKKELNEIFNSAKNTVTLPVDKISKKINESKSVITMGAKVITSTTVDKIDKTPEQMKELSKKNIKKKEDLKQNCKKG